MPSRFTSMQIAEGHIYVIGGLVNEQISRNCLEIDPNMLVTEREPLKAGRYDIPLGLVRDRYIFALGGLVNKNQATT